jgi:hypothetical protein
LGGLGTGLTQREVVGLTCRGDRIALTSERVIPPPTLAGVIQAPAGDVVVTIRADSIQTEPTLGDTKFAPAKLAPEGQFAAVHVERAAINIQPAASKLALQGKRIAIDAESLSGNVTLLLEPGGLQAAIELVAVVLRSKAGRVRGKGRQDVAGAALAGARGSTSSRFLALIQGERIPGRTREAAGRLLKIAERVTEDH